MKTVLLLASALSMAATPAFAASGGDGIGTYGIKGTASNYCVLGQVNGNSAAGLTNATINYQTANSSGNSGGTSDAMINITQLQDSNDHAAAWAATINMSNSVCNTAYNVTANSSNGGLAYNGAATGGEDFTKLLPYTLQASFGGKSGAATNANTFRNTNGNLLTSKTASSGVFSLAFAGQAQASQYLLSGTYSDVVVVTMSPSA